jgi:DNA adenine methylase
MLVAGDFETVVASATAGDLVYFDPPYVTGHNNNGFVDYNELLFSWTDQLRLARLAKELDARGVQLLISNADHDAVTALFESFEIVRVARHSTIAGRTSARQPTSEVLIYNTGRRV